MVPKKICCEIVQKLVEDNDNKFYKSVIVTTEDEVLKLTNKRYECQTLGENKWLMKRSLNRLSKR